MAFTGTLAQYVSSNKWSGVTAWATGVAKSVGDLVRQNATPTVGNERVFVCVVAGTTHATTEPTWTVTRGAKNTDNTVTWQECTGIPALNGDMTNNPNWTTVKNTSVSLGHVILSNDGTKILICDTAGTAGNGSEPSWSGTVGNTTADNTVTWRTLKISSNTFANWAAPHQLLKNAFASNWGIAGMKLFVGNSHAPAAQSSDPLYTVQGTRASPVTLLCVNESGSVPPVSGDLTTGASEFTTGANHGLRGGAFKAYGIEWGIAGASGNELYMASVDAHDKLFENCKFSLTTTSTGALIGTSNGTNSKVVLRDCVLKFGNGSQKVDGVGKAEFDNVTVDSGGTLPTVQLVRPQTTPFQLLWKNSDLSNLSCPIFPQASLSPFGYELVMENCKLGVAVTAAITGQGNTSESFQKFAFTRCDTGTNVLQSLFQMMEGQMSVDLTVTRTDGAISAAGTDYSWKVTTGTKCNPGSNPFRTFEFANYNSTLGSVTATIYGIVNAASVPNNDQVWATVDYQGSGSSPLGSRKSSRIADFLASAAALTADSTSTWDDNVTARQNTHTYSVGDIIKVASNPGRVFFCTTGGQSNGTEPAGYASAIDGGSVTDNAAVFRAGCRFKIALTLTSPNPGIAGYIYATVLFGQASGGAWYIDPFLELA